MSHISQGDLARWDAEERAAVTGFEPVPHYELNDGTCVGCGKLWPCPVAYLDETTDPTAERIEAGVAHGRALRAVGATPAEIVEALVPIADSIGELLEQVQS